jgi:hypothetical protein
MKIAILGAAGRMGRMLVALAEENGLKVTAEVDVVEGYSSSWENADVEGVIDFSFHAALPANIALAAEKGIPYGFGGIASLGRGMLPAEYIIKEHYRLGSTCVILSRSFCNANKVTDKGVLKSIFMDGVRQIRKLELECAEGRVDYIQNEQDLHDIVAQIIEEK